MYLTQNIFEMKKLSVEKYLFACRCRRKMFCCGETVKNNLNHSLTGLKHKDFCFKNMFDINGVVQTG